MRPINLAGFSGSNYAANAKLLDPSVGVSVLDAEPGYGALRPLHDRLTTATVPSVTPQLTIYRMGRDVPSDSLYWLSWSTIVHAIRSFDGADPTERIYLTGSGTPKWTDNVIGLTGGAPYPQAMRELGVPAPVTPLIATLTTDGAGTDVGDRFYVHTFINDLGWESAPSPPSTALNCHGGSIVALSALEAAPAGNYGITARRIYRTQPGTTNSSALLFLREIAIGSTSTTDDARALQDALPTVGLRPPPADLHGLIALWNQMATGISGKSILFCEPGEIYGWPAKYDFPLVDTPIALAKWEQNLLVLTTGAPVLLQGQLPESMAEQPFINSAPCASARGVVEFKHGVAWPSNDGLAYSGSSTLVTEGILTPRQWKLLRPSTIIASRWGRFYMASYDDGTGRKAFMFDPLHPADGIWWLSSGWTACWFDDLAGALFVLEGGNVRRFDAGAALLTAKFTSKVFHQTGPRNFAWCKVIADAYPITVKVYADGALKRTRTVTNGLPFTLPGGFTAEDWQVEVWSGVGDVQSVMLVTDMDDFKRV
ncbi:MAG TPA: hypothetical protein VNU71_13590 [Burkholderiaceae bacterium]|nr:hypothetical protein [Burkholderiaceae bacterium]